MARQPGHADVRLVGGERMQGNVYTSSRLKVLRRCLYEHHLRYHVGIIPIETAAMRFGTRGHEALEAYFKAWRDNASLDGRVAAALAIVDTVPDAYDRAKLRLLVIGYHERWGSSNWTILEIEKKFIYELDGVSFSGKIDALIRDDDDGRVWVVEHKTTASDAAPGTSYWDRLTIDTQVSIYVDGAATLGHDIAGCIYDVLVRPRHEPKRATPEIERHYTKGKGCKHCGGSAGGKGGIQRGAGTIRVTAPDGALLRDDVCSACDGTGWKEGKEAPRLDARQRLEDESAAEFELRLTEAIAEAPDQYFRRAPIVRLVDELPRMRADLLETIWLEQCATHEKRWPRNTDACVRYGQMCSFFDLCSSRASLDDEARFPRGRIHPELQT